MDKKKPGRRISQPWAKEDLEVSDKEVTRRGWEHQDEMRNDSMITGVDEYTTREQRNTHKGTVNLGGGGGWDDQRIGWVER